MYTYYILVPIVLLVAFLFMMWRDVRTLKSRVTDVVEQHNNVKKALDRHDSMLGSVMGGLDAPQNEPASQIGVELQPPEGIHAKTEIKEEEVEEAETTKHKSKKTKST